MAVDRVAMDAARHEFREQRAAAGSPRAPKGIENLNVSDWIGILGRAAVAAFVVGTMASVLIGALVTLAWVLLAVLGLAVMAST